MKLCVSDDTPMKLVVLIFKMYILVKKIHRDERDKYEIKGIALYLGKSGEKMLTDEGYKEIDNYDQ